MKPFLKKFGLLLRWLPSLFLLSVILFLWYEVLSGQENSVIAWLLLQQLGPVLGAIVLLLTLIFMIWKRTITLEVRVALFMTLFAIWPYSWRIWPLSIKYPTSLERANPTATVRLPADEPLLVAWGGDKVLTNYHVLYPDLRWAYDLVVEPAYSGSDRLNDYGCWGIPVLAPASGQVVLVHDGEQDEVPGRDAKDFVTAAGNHVAILLPTETYLLIGHLQQNSILVKEGMWVEEGQTLGKCGNSGDTSEPHIHIHHQRQDPAEVPIGLAEGLPLFFRDLDGEPMPEGGLRFVNFEFVPGGETVQHTGKK